MKYNFLPFTVLTFIRLLLIASCKKEKNVVCNISKISGGHHWTSKDGARNDDFPIKVINDSTIDVSGSPGGWIRDARLQLTSHSNGVSVFHTHTFYHGCNCLSGYPDINDDITLTYYCLQNKMVYEVVETYPGSSNSYELDASIN